MKTLLYSSKDFEIPFLEEANKDLHSFKYITDRLTTKTAKMALGFEAISIFSADDASGIVLEKLKDFGVKYITLRSAGYDNVNLKVARRLDFKVAHSPGYSPYAVAEHAIMLLLALNRKVVLARKQTQDYNFTLDHLIGFDLKDKTVGVVGTGKIGSVIVQLLNGFGCQLMAVDPFENEELKKRFQLSYSSLEQLLQKCQVIILSVPLTPQTHHLIDKSKLLLMQKGTLLINVARGAIIHTKDVLEHVNKNLLGGYATDVYEKESDVFFYDRSNNHPHDDDLDKMLKDDRILLTPHQGFATKEALANIAQTTVENLSNWQQGSIPKNTLLPAGKNHVDDHYNLF